MTRVLNLLMFVMMTFWLAACGGGGGSPGIPAGSANPSNFKVSAPETLTLAVGQGLSYQITGGLTPYVVTTTSPSVSLVEAKNGSLFVAGLSEGTATVNVSPNGGGAVQQIALTVVENFKPLDVQAPDSITLLPGTTVTYVVSGGVAPYRVVSSVPSGVSGGVVGNTLTVNALRAGEAKLQVFDARNTVSVSRTVTVRDETLPLFSTAPDALSMLPNSTDSFNISGGTPPYSVASSNRRSLVASIAGNGLSLNALAEGQSNVVVTDSGGRRLTMAVTVSSGAVPDLFTTAPAAVTMAPVVTRTFTIGGGVAPYTASSSNTGAVMVPPVVGSGLNITSVADGTANVVVTDARGNRVTIAVTVSSGVVADLFTTASPTLTMAQAVTRSFTIGGGVAPYTASSSNTGAVTVPPVVGSVLNITSVANGTANVLVTDARGNRVTIAVTVSSGAVADLFTTAPSTLTMAPAVTRTFTIGGGVAPYTASSSNIGSVTEPTVAGNRLSITSVADGAATVVVTDARGNQVTIALTVSSGVVADLFTTASSPLTMAPLVTRTFTIGGGVAPYTASSSNTGTVTVPPVVGSVLNITSVADGTANVLVTDARGNRVTIAVTVSSGAVPDLFTTAPASLTMALPDTRNFVIGGGVAPYTATSSNTRAVTVLPVVGTALTINSVADGTANVVVTDAGGNRVTIGVVVSGSVVSDLFTDAPATITMGPTVTRQFNIGGGVAPYTATSSNTDAVTLVPVVGNVLSITSVVEGSADIVVTDARGNRVTIAVTVSRGAVADLFTTAPAEVNMAPTVTRPFTIGGGVAPYTASSSNTRAVTVLPVVGSALSITSVADGVANVVVTDARGSRVSIAVTVSSGTVADLYTTAPPALTMGPSTAALTSTRDFTIGGGVAPYQATSTNLRVVTAGVIVPLSGGFAVQLTAPIGSLGTANVVVTDSVGKSVLIQVTVSSASIPLSLSPDKITVPVDVPARIRIVGGAAPFTVSSGIPAAMGASVVETPLGSGVFEVELTPRLASVLDVTVVDAAGQSAKVEVTTNAATPGVRIAPKALDISDRDVNRTIRFDVLGVPGTALLDVYSTDLRRLTVSAVSNNQFSVRTAALQADLDVVLADSPWVITLTIVDRVTRTTLDTATIRVSDNP